MATISTLFGVEEVPEEEVFEKASKTSPFAFINAINETKQDLLKQNPDLEKEYVPFLANRGLSYHPDAILQANEMNINHHLDNKLQFQYLLNILRKRKRYSKWHKGNKDDADLKIIQYFYKYNRSKAEHALKLLSPLQLDELRITYKEIHND